MTSTGNRTAIKKKKQLERTVAVCIVATGQPALRVATFAELATRALKHTVYGNFRSCSPQRPKFVPKYSVTHGNWPATIHTATVFATELFQRLALFTWLDWDGCG